MVEQGLTDNHPMLQMSVALHIATELGRRQAAKDSGGEAERSSSSKGGRH